MGGDNERAQLYCSNYFVAYAFFQNFMLHTLRYGGINDNKTVGENSSLWQEQAFQEVQELHREHREFTAQTHY